MIKESTQIRNVNQIQNIWKIHTDVQEQILQLRAVPVSVIPEQAAKELKLIAENLNF